MKHETYKFKEVSGAKFPCRETRVSSFKIQDSRSAGFTLIEVVVAASLMAVALTMIATIFLSAFVGQRKVIAYEQTNSNGRILMDQLSREIRASQICGDTSRPGADGSCTNPANNTPPNDLSYRLDLIRNTDVIPVSYCIFPYPPGAGIFAALGRRTNTTNFSEDPCNPLDPAVQIVNSPEVAILATTTNTNAHRLSGFITEGIGQNPPSSGPCRNTGSPLLDICQPRTTLLLRVQSLTQKEAKEKVDAQLQTTISQRLIDIP